VRTRHPTRCLIASLVFALAACTDDSPVINPDLDSQFVGYSNQTTRQTTCGNCHISKQRTWAETRHARAFETLQDIGQSENPTCLACHTTGGRGNAAADSAGFFSVSGNAKDFYKDVQCESCHGPGAGHISAPDDAQPLSTIAADSNATVGCATCHNGSHHPFVEEWQGSGHGRVIASPAANASCASCHEGRAALRNLDPDAKYQEQASATLQPITCAVCHDPHGGPNGAQLRKPIDTPDIATNLCMTCHQRRSVPDMASTSGAHSPQGPMLLGEAGWIPQDFVYDATQAASSHGSTSNPRLCAGCHVEKFTGTDALTGAFAFQSTGHSFKAIPCVDATGKPTGAATCPDTERRFNACASSGCHSNTSVARAARQVLTGRLQLYLDVLWKDKNGNGRLDPLPTDSGLLAQVRLTTPADFSATGTGATMITVGEGAWFNAEMVGRSDASMGVHNPFYAEALLLSSTAALRAKYTYLPSPPARVLAQEDERMRRLGVRRR
jgi:predicted CXXCH cytochrome family protein